LTTIVWDALMTVIEMNDKVVVLTSTVKEQEQKIRVD
jgi:hypothetical protein